MEIGTNANEKGQLCFNILYHPYLHCSYSSSAIWREYCELQQAGLQQPDAIRHAKKELR